MSPHPWLIRAAFVVAALPVLMAATAAVQEFHLVKWIKNGRCEVITALPIFDTHYLELGVFESRRAADQALKQSQRMRECPAPPKDPDDD